LDNKLTKPAEAGRLSIRNAMCVTKFSFEKLMRDRTGQMQS